MRWKKIIPFKGRNRSSVQELNFLYRSGNIFVMDNHRGALWCWLRYSLFRKVYFLHIDMHWDCLDTISQKIWNALPKSVADMSINEYDNVRHPKEKFKMFRWDNYMVPFFTNYSKKIIRKYVACHGVGSPFPFDEEIKPYNILGGLENIFDPEDAAKWIVNIDLDYFFTIQVKKQLFTDDVIKDIARQIKHMNSFGKILCCTVALSPECCGGWGESERVAKVFLEELGLQFDLDKE